MADPRFRHLTATDVCPVCSGPLKQFGLFTPNYGCRDRECDLPVEKRTKKLTATIRTTDGWTIPNKMSGDGNWLDDILKWDDEPTQELCSQPIPGGGGPCGGKVEPIDHSMGGPIVMPSGHVYNKSCERCGTCYPRPAAGHNTWQPPVTP